MPNQILRPTFTTYILNRLLNGESINIYGDVNVDEYSCAGMGIGKSRLIKDLVSLVEDEEITVISLDMKNYVFGEAFDKFLKDISMALGDKVFDSFGAFIDSTAEKKVMLLIDNFHYFFDNDKKDARFDEHFIDNLNSAHNRASISILVITHKPHKHYSLYIGETKQYRASWLEFIDIEISELTYQELKDEVDRVFPQLSEHKRVEIVGTLNGELSIAVIDKLQQLLESGQRVGKLGKLVKEVKINCNKRYSKKNIWMERWFKLWKEIKEIIPFVKGGE